MITEVFSVSSAVAELNSDLAAAGVPERPPDRLWLLRPVGGFPLMDALFAHMGTLIDERGIGGLCPELVRLWAVELARLGA
jgi:hypothetical protein